MIYVHSLGRAFRYYTQRTALVVEGAAVCFKAVHERVRNITAALAANGFAAGDPPPLLVPNFPEYHQLGFPPRFVGAFSIPPNSPPPPALINLVLLHPHT